MANPTEPSPSSVPLPTGTARTRRYEPTTLYALADRLRQAGLLPDHQGPWRHILRLLSRPGRNAEQSIPIVTNGEVEMAVDTAEHAVDLAGFLNAAGVDHLDPVPNLRPPDQDLLQT